MFGFGKPKQVGETEADGAITGHTDANLILHYSHATRESRKKATSVLETFVTDSQKKAS